MGFGSWGVESQVAEVPRGDKSGINTYLNFNFTSIDCFSFIMIAVSVFFKHSIANSWEILAEQEQDCCEDHDGL